MNQTWQRGIKLDQLMKVFTIKGVQAQSSFSLIYSDNLQWTIEISVSTLQLPSRHTTFQSLSMLKLRGNFNFAFSHFWLY